MTAIVEVSPPIQAPPPVQGLMAHKGSQLISRADLRMLETPVGTATHKPVPHADIVEAIVETLGFRHLSVLNDQYAVSPDGMKMFGVMMLSVEESGVRFCLGLRNSHDKSFALAINVGMRLLVCDNLSFYGDYQPTLRKHSAKMDLRDTIAMGIERAQRSFEPMMRRVDAWKGHELTTDAAKLVLYDCFIERAGIELPRHLGPKVAHEYFNPTFPEFQPGSLFSLEQSFTHCLKELDPIPRFQATAKLGTFLSRYHA